MGFADDSSGALSFLRKFQKDNNIDQDHMCILHIIAGVGGLESQNFASMLHTAYEKWAVSHHASMFVLKYVPGEIHDTIQEVKVLLHSTEIDVYKKLLCTETGVHRLVRVSPFDPEKRRHTSFCYVDVINVIRGETHSTAMESSAIRSYHEDRVVDHIYNKTHKVDMKGFFKKMHGKI